MKRISTYLIHGSLGSGKTTFLKQLFKSELFKDSIIIENEYASLNVDKELLGDCEVKILDVSGGCICCTSGTEFFESLEKVAKEKDVNSLFVETTGVASSVSLIKQMMLSASFDDNFSLVKNIFIIDALENNSQSLKGEKLLDILMADLIVLNKVDVVSKEKIESFAKLFEELKVHFVQTSQGKVDVDNVWSDEPSKSIEVLKDHISEILFEGTNHQKDTLYQIVYPEKKISPQEFEDIIKNHDGNIFRIKGTFTNKSGGKVSVNATPNNFDFSPTDKNEKDAIVFIGNKLTKSSIKPLVDKLC